MTARVLVTGATGFVGRALCASLRSQGWTVRAALRDPHADDLGDAERVVVGEIGSTTPWDEALAGVSVVVHLAARVHVMRETAVDPITAYREVNVLGTNRLASKAAEFGVRRLIYVSTIKVNGEETPEQAFTERDQARPSDPYAISKWEAERALHRISSDTGLEVVIVRPPLIYGPGVKGNFRSLMRSIEKGWPLPVGRCDNRRSLLGLGNFVDFLMLCARHPAAAGQTFLVSDGEDLSTPELARRLAATMDRPTRLLSIPPAWLHAATRVLGKPGIYQRLCGSLRVDASLARQMLGWAPPESVNEGLKLAVEHYLQNSDRQVGKGDGRI